MNTDERPPWLVGIIDGGLSDDERLQLIAKLPALDYDRAREDLAETLGIRRSTLDDEIVKRRNGGEAAELFERLEPWPESVNGAELLDRLAAEFPKYLVLPDHAAIALSIWVLHTYGLDAASVSPILLLQSATKRCGKTTAERLLSHLVFKPILASNITPAAMFRFIEQYQPCMIVDEFDTFGQRNPELRGVIDSGHTRGLAFVIRCDGEANEPRRFSTWCPKAIAAIGRVPDTIADRSIVIPMKRKLPSQRVARLRDHVVEHLHLRRMCLRWAADSVDALKVAPDPELPELLHDRARDNWLPLISIAELAGGTWSEFARQAAVALTQAATERGEQDAILELLLKDIQMAFGDKDRISSADLVTALVQMDTRPWAEWGRRRLPITQNQVARLLDEFTIEPKSVRLGVGRGSPTARGYTLDQFADAFSRYTPPIRSDTPTHQHQDGLCVASQSDTPENGVLDRETTHQQENGLCVGVLDRTLLPGRNEPFGTDGDAHCGRCQHFQRQDAGDESGAGTCRHFDVPAFDAPNAGCKGFTPRSTP